MPALFHCFPPCEKSFATNKALNAHISNKPECFERYSQFLLALVSLHPGAGDVVPEIDPELHDVHTPSLVSSFPGDLTGTFDDLSLVEPLPEPERPWVGQHAGMKEPQTDNPTVFTEVYPDAGKIHRRAQAPYARVEEILKQNSRGNIYYPFASQTEWGLAVFLHNNLTLSEIDKFLKLQFMQSHQPSFQSGAALRDRMEQLPLHGPRWVARDIAPEYGTPIETPVLFYRDPVDAIKYLLARPSLAEHLTFAPRKVWEDSDRESRLYSEMSTGNYWWHMQESLPIGSTAIPVILASDKTHLTNFSGDKSAWPIYMSIGNINAKTRNSPSTGSWLIVAYIPIVEFDDGPAGALADRFFHQCSRIVYSTLIGPGTSGIEISDSKGDVRWCFPRVAAYIADFPEQLLVNVAAGRNSPVTVASYHDLGDAVASPPRTYAWIIDKINQVCQKVDPANVARYVNKARKLGLNGVHLPFWKDLPGYEPDIALSPDLLHGGHMFFRVHLLKWISGLVGEEELDRRLRVLQSAVGYRHFRLGISHLKQWSGRDDRELQRVILAVIAGAPRVNPKALKSIRAFQDFLYLAQYRSHSETTLEYLSEALQTFHATKDVFISTGVRVGKTGVIPHFKIPKLAGLHAYRRHIPEMGASPQYSTEITEHNHQPMAKHAYKATNHRNYIEQMCRFLDRHERVTHFNDFHIWHAEQVRIRSVHQLLEQCSPSFRQIAAPLVAAAQQEGVDGSLVVPSQQTASREVSRLWLARKANLLRQEVSYISELYHLPDLANAIGTYLLSLPRPSTTDPSVHVSYIDVWKKLRIRLSSVQDDAESGQTHVVEALPPSAGLPYGRCHCVLLNESAEHDTGVEGYRVAQIRLLFHMHLANPAHPAHKTPLAYVQWFSRPKPTAEKDINMYLVSRVERAGSVRRGSVIALDTVSRFVQLVPKFGSVVSDQLTSENSMDICRDYWVNSFADKEIYQAVW